MVLHRSNRLYLCDPAASSSATGQTWETGPSVGSAVSRRPRPSRRGKEPPSPRVRSWQEGGSSLPKSSRFRGLDRTPRLDRLPVANVHGAVQPFTSR